jgi:hypothetical protein
VEAGIDEVGPDLERLDRETALPERFEQPQRQGGLAYSTRNARDDEDAWHGRLLWAGASP